MSQAIDVELVSKIESAAEKALNRLFAEHNESFYYITLITFGEAYALLYPPGPLKHWIEKQGKAKILKKRNII